MVGAAIAALTPGPVHLIGHSLGGAIALRTAILYPEALRALTLIAPAGLGETPSPDFIPNFLAMTDAAGVEATLKMLVTNPALINRQIVEGYSPRGTGRIFWRRGSRCCRSRMKAGARRDEAHDAVAALPMPVQVIWGEDDIVLPPPAPDALPPSVRPHLLPRLGHVPHMEAMKTVNGLITDFDRAQAG